LILLRTPPTAAWSRWQRPVAGTSAVYVACARRPARW